MDQPPPHTQPQSAGRYTLLATREYLDDLARVISATTAGDRVLLATMDFHPQGFGITAVIAACKAAAQRGVSVELFVDAHTFLVDPFGHLGPLWYGRMRRPTTNTWFAPSYQAIRDLKVAGVSVTLTNPPQRPFTSPVSGRSHIKASIINDTVYIGGHNLSYPLLDCMARFTDAATANWLYDLLLLRKQQPHTVAAFGQHDITHAVDARTNILVDTGVRRQSQIYEQALTLIDEATDWLLITCQFFPRGQIAQHLHRAQQRGVDVHILYNGASAHPPGIGRFAQANVIRHERTRLPAHLFASELPKGSPYLHAKIIATRGQAMIGSHNYIFEGVRFGTAELALYRQDADFAHSLSKLVLDETRLATEPRFKGFL